MPVGVDTYEYRRRLPHLIPRDAVYAVAFATKKRERLPPGASTLVLRSCVHDHGTHCWIDAVVVMPDHVHLIFMSFGHMAPEAVIARMKGASSYFVNRLLGRRGPLWHEESFDRIVRSDDKLYAKRDYLFNNPVRAGLVATWEEYPWVWFTR